MKKALKVAKFEFLEKVKTKAFVIYMIVFPIIIVAITITPTLLISQEKETPKPLGILDLTQQYSSQLVKKINSIQLNSGQPVYIPVNLYHSSENHNDLIKQADKNVITGIINGYLLITPDSTSPGNVSVSFRDIYINNVENINRLEDIFNEINTSLHLQNSGYNPEIVKQLISNVKLKPAQIFKDGEKAANLEEVFFSSIVFLMLLFMMILFSGGLLIRSLVEEKSNRIMEILLSSCSAGDLLTGKILGLGMLGLFQLLIWAVLALLLLGSNFITADIFDNIGLSLIYFLLGYMLFTSIFVGIGSIVNTEQEAQQITSYLSLLMILPLVIAIKVIQSPDVLLVKILSYIPLTSPPIMLLRLKTTTPPFWEILLTIFLLIFSIFLVIFISSKIFRIGILSYGKKPSVKELYQWIREL